MCTECDNTMAAPQDGIPAYDAATIETKWQKAWADEDLFKTD